MIEWWTYHEHHQLKIFDHRQCKLKFPIFLWALLPIGEYIQLAEDIIKINRVSRKIKDEPPCTNRTLVSFFLQNMILPHHWSCLSASYITWWHCHKKLKIQEWLNHFWISWPKVAGFQPKLVGIDGNLSERTLTIRTQIQVLECKSNMFT